MATQSSKYLAVIDNMSNMYVYDIIILILVGWLTLRGAMKGMVSQLASIAAVIASFWAAVRFGPVLQPIMESTFKAEPPWDKVLAITIAFVGASIAVMFLKSIVTKIISAIRMNKFDRLCGAMFGFLKGVLIGMIITFFAVMLSEQTRDLATQSHSGKILARLIQRTQTFLPEDVSTLIETNLEGFQKHIDSGAKIVDGTITQAGEASKALSFGKKALETIQNAATPLMPKMSGSSDPADDPPRLSSETQTRSHQLPAELMMAHQVNRPATQETGSMNSTMPGIQFNNAPHYGNLTTETTATISTSASSTVLPTSSVSTSIVAPSADLQPMTSTTTPPLPTETDWRTLFREMK